MASTHTSIVLIQRWRDNLVLGSRSSVDTTGVPSLLLPLPRTLFWFCLCRHPRRCLQINRALASSHQQLAMLSTVAAGAGECLQRPGCHPQLRRHRVFPGCLGAPNG